VIVATAHALVCVVATITQNRSYAERRCRSERERRLQLDDPAEQAVDERR
jgi:hypothetical protein